MALNDFSTTSRIESINPNLNRVVATLNASDLAVLIESSTPNLDFDMQDQSFQISVDRTSTSVEVVLVFQ